MRVFLKSPTVGDLSIYTSPFSRKSLRLGLPVIYKKIKVISLKGAKAN